MTWQVPDEAFAVNLEEIGVALASLRAPVVLMNIPHLALAPHGFHPSAEGYQEWTAQLWPAVRAAL